MSNLKDTNSAPLASGSPEMARFTGEDTLKVTIKHICTWCQGSPALARISCNGQCAVRNTSATFSRPSNGPQRKTFATSGCSPTTPSHRRSSTFDWVLTWLAIQTIHLHSTMQTKVPRPMPARHAPFRHKSCHGPQSHWAKHHLW